MSEKSPDKPANTINPIQAQPAPPRQPAQPAQPPYGQPYGQPPYPPQNSYPTQPTTYPPTNYAPPAPYQQPQSYQPPPQQQPYPPQYGNYPPGYAGQGTSEQPTQPQPTYGNQPGQMPNIYPEQPPQYPPIYDAQGYQQPYPPQYQQPYPPQGAYPDQYQANQYPPHPDQYQSPQGVNLENLKLNVDNNSAAALSYILMFVSGLYFLLTADRNNSYVRFHAMQAVLFNIGAIFFYVITAILFAILSSLMVVLGIPKLLLLFGLFANLLVLAIFVIWIKLMYEAYRGNKWKLPFIGDLAERQSTSNN